MNIFCFGNIALVISNFQTLIELNLNVLDTNLFNILACLGWALFSLSKVVKKPGKELKRNKEFRQEFVSTLLEAQNQRSKATQALRKEQLTFLLLLSLSENIGLKRKQKIVEDGMAKVLEEGRKRLAAIYRDGGANV
jgi:hypothetical protein